MHLIHFISIANAVLALLLQHATRDESGISLSDLLSNVIPLPNFNSATNITNTSDSLVLSPVTFSVGNQNKSYEVDSEALSLAVAGSFGELDKMFGKINDDALDNPATVTKRGLTELVTVKNQKTYYSVELAIGSRSDKVNALLDTGSSDLWVPSRKISGDSGVFMPSKSSSYAAVLREKLFSISYGDKSYAKGVWGQDTVALGQMKVQGLQMGVVDNTTAVSPILGMGLPGLEGAKTKYRNLPVLLKQQGYIRNTTYSLFLNSPAARSGLILFGAVDTKKYEGPLRKLDLVSINDAGKAVALPVAFFVNLTRVGTATEDFSSGSAYPALLDLGTTLLYAPPAVYTALNTEYGHHIPFFGYVSKCNKHAGKNLTFEFPSSVKVQVPVDNLMYPLYHKNGNPVKSPLKQEPYCMVGVQKSSGDFYILGDNFLRSAYVHYDLDAKKVGMAQVKYSKESNIVEA